MYNEMMDTHILVSEIIYRLIHTRETQPDPIQSCTDQVLAEFQFHASDAERAELRNFVSAKLRAFATNKLPFSDVWLNK